MTITVTKADIKAGICHAPWGCALALAINRARPCGQGGWRVATDSVISYEPSIILLKLPPEAIAFMRKFDGEMMSRKWLQPITFELSERNTWR